MLLADIEEQRTREESTYQLHQISISDLEDGTFSEDDLSEDEIEVGGQAETEAWAAKKPAIQRPDIFDCQRMTPK